MRSRSETISQLEASPMVTLLPEMMRDLPEIRLALNGAIIVLAVLFLPRGLFGWRMKRRAA